MDSSGSQRSVAGCVFLGVLCEYVRDEVLHIMKLFTKKSTVLQMFFMFHDVFFVSFEHVTFMEIIVQCILMQS